MIRPSTDQQQRREGAEGLDLLRRARRFLPVPDGRALRVVALMNRQVTAKTRRPGAWQVHVAASTVLSDPGPTAIAVAVIGPDGRQHALRSWYVGKRTREDAEAQALATGRALASQWQLPEPVLCSSWRKGAQAPDVRYCAPRRNLALAHSVRPVTAWLPNRAQHADGLPVAALGEGRYRVASESQPEHAYLVDLGAGACECPDFVHRHLPCKHLLCAARAAGIDPLDIEVATTAPDTVIKPPASLLRALAG